MEAAGVQVKRGPGRGDLVPASRPGPATRFRASSLGIGYGPEDVEAVIDGGPPVRKPAQGGPARQLPSVSI